MYYTTFSK